MYMVSVRPGSCRRAKENTRYCDGPCFAGLYSLGASTLGLLGGAVCKAEEAERRSKVNAGGGYCQLVYPFALSMRELYILISARVADVAF
jgi:hypothetical protein